MAITDLTGTTWKLPDTFNMSTYVYTGQQRFYLIGTLYTDVNDWTFESGHIFNGLTYDMFEVAYDTSSNHNFVKCFTSFGSSYTYGLHYSNVKNKWYYNKNGPSGVPAEEHGNYYYTSTGPILTINGGTDATNTTLISWLEANATLQAPTISFKHLYRNTSLIGTGAIKFRPYTVATPLPQLAAPQNVTADGTTVSWNEVENATSYAVLADGSEIGTVEAAATPILITFTISGISYQAEEGMTWEEWVNSSYNIGGYEIVGAYITKRYTEASYFQVRLNNVAVVSSDKIEPNTSYTEIRQSGGGGSGN